nr:hypothetical protein [Nostoc sp. DedQUE02]
MKGVKSVRSPYEWGNLRISQYTQSFNICWVRSQWTAVSSHLELEDDNKNMVRVYG